MCYSMRCHKHIKYFLYISVPEKQKSIENTNTYNKVVTGEHGHITHLETEKKYMSNAIYILKACLCHIKFML